MRHLHTRLAVLVLLSGALDFSINRTRLVLVILTALGLTIRAIVARRIAKCRDIVRSAQQRRRVVRAWRSEGRALVIGERGRLWVCRALGPASLVMSAMLRQFDTTRYACRERAHSLLCARLEAGDLRI